MRGQVHDVVVVDVPALVANHAEQLGVAEVIHERRVDEDERVLVGAVGGGVQVRVRDHVHGGHAGCPASRRSAPRARARAGTGAGRSSRRGPSSSALPTFLNVRTAAATASSTGFRRSKVARVLRSDT